MGALCNVSTLRFACSTACGNQLEQADSAQKKRRAQRNVRYLPRIVETTTLQIHESLHHRAAQKKAEDKTNQHHQEAMGLFLRNFWIRRLKHEEHVDEEDGRTIIDKTNRSFHVRHAKVVQDVPQEATTTIPGCKSPNAGGNYDECEPPARKLPLVLRRSAMRNV